MPSFVPSYKADKKHEMYTHSTRTSERLFLHQAAGFEGQKLHRSFSIRRKKNEQNNLLEAYLMCMESDLMEKVNKSEKKISKWSEPRGECQRSRRMCFVLGARFLPLRWFDVEGLLESWSGRNANVSLYSVRKRQRNKEKHKTLRLLSTHNFDFISFFLPFWIHARHRSTLFLPLPPHPLTSRASFLFLRFFSATRHRGRNIGADDYF